MKRETPSPKLPSSGDGGTATNHRVALSLSSSLFHPPLRPWESEPRSPHWGLLLSFGFHDLLLTPGAHRSLTPQPGQAAAPHPPLQVGPPDKVQTPVGGGSRPFPRAARPRAGSRPEEAGGRAGAGRRRGSQGRRAVLGWAPGAYLGAPAAGAWGSGSSSREAVARAPAAAAVPPGLRWGSAQTLSRYLLQPGAAAAAAAPGTARPGAAPKLSNSGGRRAEAPGGGPSAERLRALPRPGEGRVPGARGARPALWPGSRPRGLDPPTPPPRAEAGEGLPGRHLRGTHTRANEAGPFGGPLPLQSLPQHRCL